jgi:predicted RNA-binding Zn-ribbon protein involved in translation (DUF1610 family)
MSMPIHCQDCNAHFLLSNADVTHGVSCPQCGSTGRLERDQPSPTNSDGDLRDMVDPSTGLDQGGNPLQEGMLGGWQNRQKRDESFASVRKADSMHPPALTEATGKYPCPDCGTELVENDDPKRTYHPDHFPPYMCPNCHRLFMESETHPPDTIPHTWVSTVRPRFNNMKPYMPWTHEADTKQAFLPFLAPLLEGASGLLSGSMGKLLLAQGAGGLLRGAFKGTGNDQPMNIVGAPGMPPPTAKTADMETPHSNPVLHDSPDGDTQEFDSGDMSPAFQNPNIPDQGGSDKLEDGVAQRLEFRHDDPTLDEIHHLLPKLLEYYHKPESGLNDPILRALHEKIDQERPGYLDQTTDDDPGVQALLEAIRQPQGVTAGLRDFFNPGSMPQDNQLQERVQQYMAAGYNENDAYHLALQESVHRPMGIADGHFGALPPAATTFGTMPQVPGGPGTLPGQMPAQGTCVNCGGTLNADGTCSQCGYNNVGQQPGGAATLPNLHQPGVQAPGVQTQAFAKTAADTQGPVTKEQQAAVADLLIQQGRHDEVSRMLLHPEEYTDLLEQVQGQDETQPPTVDPNVQAPMAPPPAAPTMAMPGQMPPQGPPGMMPTGKVAIDMSNGDYTTPSGDRGIYYKCPNCGGQMSEDGKCYRCGYTYGYDGGEVLDGHHDPLAWARDMGVPSMNADWGPRHQGKVAADSLAPRCPKCESATTGFIDDQGTARCHACGNIYNNDNVNKDKISRTWTKKADFDPVAVPAADQDAQPQPNQDSSLTWQDSTGQPLQEGGLYMMHSNQYSIPDKVRIESVKPDGITITQVGENDPNQLGDDSQDPGYTHEITKEVADMDGLTFEAMDDGEEEETTPGEGPGQTVNTEPVSTPDVGGIRASVDDRCPKCSYTHVTSSYTSPTTKKMECYRCANEWTVQEEQVEGEVDPETREWLQGDSGPIDFDPRALAMATSGKSRNISDIAARDPRNAAISSMLKEAGRNFSPREQKDFVDEEGTARNMDRLNLEGTHYQSAFDLSKARADVVNDDYIGFY